VPFGPPPPTAYSDSVPGYGPNQDAGYGQAGYGQPGYGQGAEYAQGPGYGQGPAYGSPDYGQSAYATPPMDPGQYYAGYQQQPPRPPHTGRNLAAVLGTLGVVTTLIVVLVVTNHHPASTANASSTGTATSTVTDTETDTAQPTDTSTDDDVLPTDTDTADDFPTDTEFDPSTLDNASTDTAPFTADALLPDTFTDSKDIEYQIEAAGVEKCVQSVMSSNVQNELRKYGCSQVVTGSYTVDSDTVTSDENILVSVQIFAFKDEATAKTVYADFPSTKNWDFGIWCPKTGDGAHPCANGADYQDAYQSEWIGQDYRYVIEATAMYTDLSQDSSVGPWTSAAAKEAVNDSGPAYYISTQD
jgi:hypothetical protein